MWTSFVSRSLKVKFSLIILLRCHVIEDVSHSVPLIEVSLSCKSSRLLVRCIVVTVSQHIVILTIKSAVITLSVMLLLMLRINHLLIRQVVVLRCMLIPTFVAIDHYHWLNHMVTVILILRGLPSGCP